MAAVKHATLQLLVLLGLWMQIPSCTAQPILTLAPPSSSTNRMTPSMPPNPTTMVNPTTQPMPDPTTPSAPNPSTEAVPNPTTPPVPNPTTPPVPNPTTPEPVPDPTTQAIITSAPTMAPTLPPTVPPTMPPTEPPCPSKCTCNMAARTVNCENQALSSIPLDLPSDTQTLYLTGNAFSILREGAFGHLPDLANLYLVSCGIQSIADRAFEGLSHLRVLNLRNNRLTLLNGLLTGMPELEMLDLESNHLTDLSDQVLNNLPQLKTLNIGSNNIQQVSVGAFNSNPMLKTLSISYCDLSQITPMVFQNLMLLEVLDLSGNQIAEITSGAFQGLSSLQELRLSSTQLSTLSDMAFQGLPQLKTLNLANNLLTNLNTATLMPLTSLSILVLTENPWDCNCGMGNLIAWLKDTSLHQIDFYSSRSTCLTPVDLEGRRLDIIQQEQFACVPVFTLIPNSLVVGYEELAIFQCNARGDPTPQIEWYLPDGSRVTTMSNAENVYTSQDGTVLIIQRPQAANSGTYNCTARNSNGASSLIVSLDVTGVPTTIIPTTKGEATTAPAQVPPCTFASIQVRVVEITDTTIEMRWTTYNDPRLKGYIIQVTEFGSALTTTKLADETDTSFVVTDLVAGTNYVICISVFLEQCPSYTTTDQCEQLTTGGKTDDGIAALVTKHRNEIIGTAVATFCGTLFILASIFVILWQYRKPKFPTQYDFKSTQDTARFADMEMLGDLGESSQGARIQYTGSVTYDNRGAVLADEAIALNDKQHEAEVYSIPPDALYAEPHAKGKGKGNGKGKGKRNSKAPLIEIEMQGKNDKRHSDYMVPTPTKEEDAPVLEAKLVGQEEEGPEVGEFGHLYEELDNPKCDCDPKANGIIQSNGHVPSLHHSNDCNRNGTGSKVRFSLPEEQTMTPTGNGDLNKSEAPLTV